MLGTADEAGHGGASKADELLLDASRLSEDDKAAHVPLRRAPEPEVTPATHEFKPASLAPGHSPAGSLAASLAPPEPPVRLTLSEGHSGAGHSGAGAGQAGGGQATGGRAAGAGDAGAAGGTLFERMANLTGRRKADEEDEEDGDETGAVNIPRFLGRQNNQ